MAAAAVAVTVVKDAAVAAVAVADAAVATSSVLQQMQ